jgi:hypothetical protein
MGVRKRAAALMGVRGTSHPLTRSRSRWVRELALGGLLALSWCTPAGAVLVDAVLAQVESAVVSASDIAIARALGLFGFTPSDNPIDAADVDRYATALGEVLEATRLGLAPSVSEIDQAWADLEERRGGAQAFRAWLDLVAVDAAWARRALEAHLRWRAWAQFHEGFTDEPARPGESAAVKPLTGKELVVRRLLAPSETVPVPFPMPR